jgi:hypothetical protein
MLFSGGHAALIHIGDSRAFQLRGCRLRPIIEDHTLGNLTWSPGLLAPALKRHLDGRLDRSADLSLRDLRTYGRYLLRPGGLSPVIDDRPHFYVLTLHAASTDAPSNWPPQPGPGPMWLNTRTAAQGPACGVSRLPVPAHCRSWAPADQPR